MPRATEKPSDTPIKVCLVNRGADSETPWALDLGPAPAPAPKGSRRVQIVNVPFLHAKPTWGDVVIVSPGKDGLLTWDRDGVAWPQIDTRIVEDGGRWAMIIDYTPAAKDATGEAAFRAICAACETTDIVCEGAWGARKGQTGRVYLAPRHEVTADAVMATLARAQLPCVLALVHPAPAPVAKKQPAAAAKPQAKATKPEPKATKPQAKATKPEPKAAKPKPKATKPEPKAKPKGSTGSSARRVRNPRR